MTDKELTYSVVMPVYQAGAYIVGSVERVLKVMDNIGEPYELILVDDHSSDNTWSVISDLADQYEVVKAIKLSKNIGQTPATQVGAEEAQGLQIITLDDDMQHPPEEIPKLIQAQKELGKSIVFGDPEDRHHAYKEHGLLVKIGEFFFHSVFMREYRHVKFFTTFRIFYSSILSKNGGPLDQLFFIWKIPADSAAHIATEHVGRKQGSSNHGVGATIRHYAPFWLYFIYLTASWTLYMLLVVAIIMVGYFVWKAIPALNNFTVALIVCAILLNLIKYITAYRLNKIGSLHLNVIEAQK